MRALIVAAGSRGDVAPYTGLGVRLREAGHEVTIAAHEPFRDLVADAGLGFAPLPGDIRGLIEGDRPSALQLAGKVRLLSAYLEELAAGTLAAARSADVLLVGGTATFAYHVAEGLGLPSLGVYLQPFEPTGEFPPVLSNQARSLGRYGNRWLGEALLAALFPYNRVAARLRRELGLPREGERALRRRLAAARWPVFHGYSPAVLPRPADWPPGMDVVGYWWPAPAAWTPPPELTEFLAAGPPPVLVTFGSMVAGPWLGEVVTEAVRRAGVRAVVQAGWAGLAVDAGPDLLPLGSAPHDRLMPGMALVVHHAGAGTTAAAARAGVPVVTAPIYADQPLWAARAAALGLGPPPVPFRRLTAERLAAAIRAGLDPAHRDRARTLAARLAAEDGAAPVVAAVDRLAAAGRGTPGV